MIPFKLYSVNCKLFLEWKTDLRLMCPFAKEQFVGDSSPNDEGLQECP